ncbi:unnamed protein product [Brassica napus]|uniref:(rape) hypothetical protein n=1 Tax=Brassica napus TaxID=3708 RepID=A0A816K2R7_BRANA|nr:unnamed protein product [Brassica napus]
MDLSSTDVQGTVRFRDGYQEKSKSLEGRFWYSENWDNRLFQRDIHNEIHATKDISSGCYLQGIELWEYKWDTINNGLCQGCQGCQGLCLFTCAKGDMIGFDLEYDLRNCFWGSKWFGDHDSHCVWNLRLFVTYENEVRV